MCERRESNQSSLCVCSWSSTRLCRRCTLWVTVCPWSRSLQGAPSSVCSGNNIHQLALQITLSTLSSRPIYSMNEWPLLQEATLHQELHPPQPLLVLHPASWRCAGERWHTLQSNVPVLQPAITGEDATSTVITVPDPVTLSYSKDQSGCVSSVTFIADYLMHPLIKCIYWSVNEHVFYNSTT